MFFQNGKLDRSKAIDMPRKICALQDNKMLILLDKTESEHRGSGGNPSSESAVFDGTAIYGIS
jgi:hypothetical protein